MAAIKGKMEGLYLIRKVQSVPLALDSPPAGRRANALVGLSGAEFYDLYTDPREKHGEMIYTSLVDLDELPLDPITVT